MKFYSLFCGSLSLCIEFISTSTVPWSSTMHIFCWFSVH